MSSHKPRNPDNLETSREGIYRANISINGQSEVSTDLFVQDFGFQGRASSRDTANVYVEKKTVRSYVKDVS